MKLRPTNLAAALVAAACTTLAFPPARAATPADVNVANTHRDWFDAVATVQTGDQGTLAGVLVAKAPSNRALVITDFVMTHNVNTTTGTFRANFRRALATGAVDCDTASLVLGPYIGARETVAISLSTGLRLEPGEQLCLAVGGAGAGEGITFTISGYEAAARMGP